MNVWNLEKMVALLYECGDIALRYYENPPCEIKDDNSVVTAADRAIEERLASEFDLPESGLRMIGEETINTHGEEYIQAAIAGDCFVVDPIDGTAPYSIHFPAWGISVGYMRNGRIVEGAVYFPVFDELMITDGPDAWLYRKDGRIPYPFEVPRIDKSRSLGVSQEMIRHGRLDMTNHLVAWDTAVGVFHYMMQGKLLGYVSDLKIWDIAGCLALMERGGFTGRTYDGKTIGCDAIAAFHLEPSPKRWRMRQTTVFAANLEIIEYIQRYSQPDSR